MQYPVWAESAIFKFEAQPSSYITGKKDSSALLRSLCICICIYYFNFDMRYCASHTSRAKRTAQHCWGVLAMPVSPMLRCCLYLFVIVIVFNFDGIVKYLSLKHSPAHTSRAKKTAQHSRSLFVFVIVLLESWYEVLPSSYITGRKDNSALLRCVGYACLTHAEVLFVFVCHCNGVLILMV